MRRCHLSPVGHNLRKPGEPRLQLVIALAKYGPVCVVVLPVHQVIQLCYKFQQLVRSNVDGQFQLIIDAFTAVVSPDQLLQPATAFSCNSSTSLVATQSTQHK